MDRVKAQFIEGIVSIIVNSILFVVKLWAGLISGSIALVADAWHTLSDSISSVIVVIAAKLASKKADKEHPFGHGRWELICSLFIAFILGIIAFDFLKSSIIKFNSKEQAEFGAIAVIVIITSIAAKELLAQYALYIWRKTGNAAIKADAWHHRSDALSSVIVLVGILFAKEFWWLDSVLGIIISLMLFYAVIKIMREASAKLLGESPKQDLIDKINEEVKKVYKNNLNVHHFHLHNYILHKELTLHIRLDKDITIENGHKIATTIENMIEEQFDIVTTVHIEPL